MSISIVQLFKHLNSDNYADKYIQTAKNFINTSKKLDPLSKKIVSNSNFWEFLNEHYPIVNKDDIPHLIKFIEDIYNLYARCNKNDFSSNFKPIDKKIGLEIDTDDLDENDGECFSTKALLVNIITESKTVSSEEANNIAQAILNVVSEISPDNVSENLNAITDSIISRGWVLTSFRDILFYSIASILYYVVIGPAIYKKYYDLNTRKAKQMSNKIINKDLIENVYNNLVYLSIGPHFYKSLKNPINNLIKLLATNKDTIKILNTYCSNNYYDCYNSDTSPGLYLLKEIMYIFEDEDFDITSSDYINYNILNPTELIDSIMRIYDNEIRGYTNEYVNKLKNNAIKLLLKYYYKQNQ